MNPSEGAPGIGADKVKTWGMVCVKGRLRLGNSLVEAEDYFSVESILHARFHWETNGFSGPALHADLTLALNGRLAEIHLEGEGAITARRILAEAVNG